VIANMSRQAQEGCTLSMEGSPMEGDYEFEGLMGSVEFSPISFDSNGAVDEYALPEVIEPWSYYILKLQP